MMTLDEFLTQQEALVEKATEGPWHCAKHSNDVRNVDKDLICTPFSCDQSFIASARTSVPLLLRMVRELTRLPDIDGDTQRSRLRVNRELAERILNEKEELK